MRIQNVIVFSVFALLLVGCAASEDTSLAEKQVPQFHEMLDAGQFQAIYSASSEDLKKIATEKDFVALLDAVHRKLGATKSSEKKGWKINFHTSGTFVALTYKTAYNEGDATEEFVYRVKADQALLVGYHVNSNALILK